MQPVLSHIRRIVSKRRAASASLQFPSTASPSIIILGLLYNDYCYLAIFLDFFNHYFYHKKGTAGGIGMSINQRLRQVRKHLKMQQSEFAKRLGLSQTSISWLEQDGNTVSEQTIRLLHLDFHVSEEWLRTGEGPMFSAEDDSPLEKLCREYAVSDCERKILELYFSFEPKRRKMVCDFVDEFFRKAIEEKQSAQNPSAAKTDEGERKKPEPPPKNPKQS
ncbi:MAG: helix-turn-helix transcriptional regulator [Schwartzia succinivorans]|nr:helix-turn-helix transcriptional regulator [Schwartzia succinivorans]